MIIHSQAIYLQVTDLLNRRCVAFREIVHQDMFRSDQETSMTGLQPCQGAKSLLLHVKEKAPAADSSGAPQGNADKINGYILAVLPGNCRLDSKKAKTALQCKSVRFATESEVSQIMGCPFGACHPFGSLARVRTVVDPLLAQNREIALNPGLNDRSIIMSFNDYLAIEKPDMVSLSSTEDLGVAQQ
jgi:Ala-tRNA(Pro) deacylase